MVDQIVETWEIHTRINLHLLDVVDEAVFGLPRPKRGRAVPQIFAHIHNVRWMWLQSAEPELLAGLSKVARDDSPGQTALKALLAASADAVAGLFSRSLAQGGRIRGFKPHVAAFLGYLISHEAYHHGEIGVALTAAGYPLPKTTAFKTWEWGQFVDPKGAS